MYGFHATLELSFDDALERVMAVLKQEASRRVVRNYRLGQAHIRQRAG
jgi:uncharacterized protein (DUF302 family)